MHFSRTDSESYSNDDQPLDLSDVFKLKTIQLILQFHIQEKIHISGYTNMNNSDNVNYNTNINNYNTNINNL